MNSRSDVETVVQAYLAERRMQETAAYLRRGRRLKDATPEALEAIWVESVRLWAEDPIGRVSDQNRDDICAEYTMRGLDLPEEPVRDFMDKITSAIAGGAAHMDDEAKQRLGDEVFGLWQRKRDRRN